ncbi:MAG: sensor histidine kinase, partial [Burkholderiales bacterium]
MQQSALKPDAQDILSRVEPGLAPPPAMPAADGETLSSVRQMYMEELLRSYQRLQEKNRQSSVALASAAHELRTPLSVMSGYIDVLLSEKLGDLNERQRQILQEMQSSSSRLEHFIEDFLTYSALETGKLTLAVDTADLNACLAEIAGFWLLRFKEKGVALYHVPAENVKPFVFDYYKIQHVVSNLLHNALKFTATGGTAWLASEPYDWERRSRPQGTAPGDRRSRKQTSFNGVRVTVSDTGIGLAPEFQQEVFDDFFKLTDA